MFWASGLSRGEERRNDALVLTTRVLAGNDLRLLFIRHLKECHLVPPVEVFVVNVNKDAHREDDEYRKPARHSSNPSPFER